MSALQVYLSWANSILSDSDPSLSSSPTVTVDSIRQGKVLYQLIKTFWDTSQDETLQRWDPIPDSSPAIDFIRAALWHLEERNLKVNFNAEDILKGDVKSILDLLWLLILNFNINDAGTNQYHQCSVGAGRRILLSWCQDVLVGLQLDKRCSLVKSLCTNDHFIMLLESTPGLKLPAEDLPTKSQHLVKLLENIECQFGIRKDILSVPELIAGTIDEQILMIYLALLKWKIQNNQNKLKTQRLLNPLKQTAPPASSSLSSLERTSCRQIERSQINRPEKQTLSPQQSTSTVDSSSEKDQSRQITRNSSPQFNVLRTLPLLGVDTKTSLFSSSSLSQQEKEAKINKSARTQLLSQTGISSSLDSDRNEYSLEDELNFINDSVQNKNSLQTPTFARSLTPSSNYRLNSRPDCCDSPFLFSRPRSAMELTNWADNCMENREKIKLGMKPSSFSTSLSDISSKTLVEDQQNVYYSKYKSSGNEDSHKEIGIDTDSKTLDSPQRRRTPEHVPEGLFDEYHLNHQVLSPAGDKHGEDGKYSFKKAIISKDGGTNKAQLMTVNTNNLAKFCMLDSPQSVYRKVPQLKKAFSVDKTDSDNEEDNVEVIGRNNEEHASSTPPPPPPLPSLDALISCCSSQIAMEQYRRFSPRSTDKENRAEMTETASSNDCSFLLANSSRDFQEGKVLVKEDLQETEIEMKQHNNEEQERILAQRSNNRDTITEYKIQDGSIESSAARSISKENVPSNSSNYPEPNLAAASATSEKIDILCIEIGELKKKVMAMETGKTYLADLNRMFQSTLESNGKRSEFFKETKPKKFLEERTLSQTGFPNDNDFSADRLNQTWSPSTDSLLDMEAEAENNEARSSSMYSLPFKSGHPREQDLQNVSSQAQKSASTDNFFDNSVSSTPSQNSKEHLWRVGNKRDSMVRLQRNPKYIERHIIVRSMNAASSPVKKPIDQPLNLGEEKDLNKHTSKDMMPENEAQFESDKKIPFEKDFDLKIDRDNKDPHAKSPFNSVIGNRELEEMLSRYASSGNMILGRMCTFIKQLKEENEELKFTLQQEMTRLQKQSKCLEELQEKHERDLQMMELEQLVQKDQAFLQQENAELREKLQIAEGVNTELRADVLKLQEYKAEIQHTQRNLREQILGAEKDKKLLTEELNLLWRQRKAIRKSNYENFDNSTVTGNAKEMRTPPKSRASLVEAAFSKRLNQVENKMRSPLTSSPAGQRSSVTPFPVSPVICNDLGNQTPNSLLNRHSLGLFYPETPKTYRTVSYLQREKNCNPSPIQTPLDETSPQKSSSHNLAPKIGIDQLLDDTEGFSESSTTIAYADDEDDEDYEDGDDNGNGMIQLQKTSRPYWSDENLSRHSEKVPNSWVTKDSFEKSSYSSNSLHLLPGSAPTNSGRRRINNVTFNLSNSLVNLPSKQKSTLKGILKKASSPTHQNSDGVSKEHQKISDFDDPSKHHRSSEDLFLELSQQDFLDPPNIQASNSSKVLLASGMSRRWSSHDSLHSKYSPSSRQKDFMEHERDRYTNEPSEKSGSVSFSEETPGGSQNPQHKFQNQVPPTDLCNIQNQAIFRRFIYGSSIENSPEARPLFGDPNNSRWSFTPYNFYLETLSKQLKDQRKSPEGDKLEGNFFSPEVPRPTSPTKKSSAKDTKTELETEDTKNIVNHSPTKISALHNNEDKTTPAKESSLISSSASNSSLKFSAVLSPEQVQFSPTTEADHKAIVRNLCSVFENSDLSLDGSEPGSAKKTRTWYDLDKTSPAQLTDEQRSYANTLIEKYTRLPTDRRQKSAT